MALDELCSTDAGAASAAEAGLVEDDEGDAIAASREGSVKALSIVEIWYQQPLTVGTEGSV